jgi:hypothetical protein
MTNAEHKRTKPRIATAFQLDGAAPESNRASLGLPDLTGFEDPLGHRPPPLQDRIVRFGIFTSLDLPWT